MRLFVAVEFPEAVRKRAWRAAAPLHEADLPVRWVGPERLHLTLKFLGETDRSRLPGLRRALDAAAAETPPLELRLGGVGGFPSLAAPRVLWLGVDAPPELAELHREVDERLAGLGFERDDRAFHPHITLGRVRRGVARGALSAARRLAGRVGADLGATVDEVGLIESVLRPDGARYTTVSSHTLAGGSRRPGRADTEEEEEER